mmetsp:Transcript_26067/g.62612  ORF Transcript_26067/g.62612 Transcript_26067/m.62612 type:complete len:272 (-) Transcript_26067:1220-2035(-)
MFFPTWVMSPPRLAMAFAAMLARAVDVAADFQELAPPPAMLPPCFPPPLTTLPRVAFFFLPLLLVSLDDAFDDPPDRTPPPPPSPSLSTSSSLWESRSDDALLAASEAENASSSLIFFWRAACSFSIFFTSSLSSNMDCILPRVFGDTPVPSTFTSFSTTLLCFRTFRRDFPVPSVSRSLADRSIDTSVSFSTSASARPTHGPSPKLQSTMERCVNWVFPSSESNICVHSPSVISRRPSIMMAVREGSFVLSLWMKSDAGATPPCVSLSCL